MFFQRCIEIIPEGTAKQCVPVENHPNSVADNEDLVYGMGESVPVYLLPDNPDFKNDHRPSENTLYICRYGENGEYQLCVVAAYPSKRFIILRVEDEVLKKLNEALFKILNSDFWPSQPLRIDDGVAKNINEVLFGSDGGNPNHSATSIEEITQSGLEMRL